VSRDSVLALGRIAAEAGMLDACTIRRVNGGSTTDQSTGVRTKTYDSLYTGKCRVQAARPMSQDHEVGEDYVLLLRLDVQLPMSVTGLAVNDEITITASVNDADLVGRVLLVQDLFHKSEATARRVGVIERTAT
jgi:hypothetical protein